MRGGEGLGPVPEQVSGPSGVPTRGDSEQGIKDTLARLEAKIDRLAEQLADAEAEAEAIMRRAEGAPVPSHRRAQGRRRRGDTVLRVVKAAVVAVVSLGIVVAMLAPARVHREQYSPRCSVACSRPVVVQVPRKTGG